MRKSRITAAIITKNEERHIVSCIERIKGWADEVIIVDGFSGDRTAELAETMGARVIRHRFEGDFSKERNIGMENASGDWVLHLDADDRVTEAFKDACDGVIDDSDGIDAYKFRRRNCFLGHFMEHGGFCHFIPNLVRRGRVVFEGALHERPVYEGGTGEINADIEHYPFDTIEQFVDRQNRYSTIEAKRMFAERGKGDLKIVRKNAAGRTFKIFWKIYVKKKGYRDGMYGLIFAALFAFTNFMVWTKYWELCVKEGS
ncbi:MAG: glycosyltransferase family 2 protein [Candidatus Omnitrophota bacterium]